MPAIPPSPSAPRPVADTAGRAGHWNQVYATKATSAVSWYQRSPEVSLALIANAGIGRSAPIIDIGGGASTLADALLARGCTALTVLDIAETALDAARRRLGPSADRIRWVVADVTKWQPETEFALWHDRAVFHFLIAEAERRRYMAALRTALLPEGTAIFATFAPDGPERCSGLPVRRYSPEMLAAELGADFALIETVAEDHHTPADAVQRFLYCRFRRMA